MKNPIIAYDTCDTPSFFFNVCMLIPSYMFIFLPNKLFDIEWEFYAAAVFLE